MKFVALIKFKQKMTKYLVAPTIKEIEYDKKHGSKLISAYWTLGRYDAVAIMEAPDESAAMKTAIRRGDIMSLETMAAIPVEEARKLVE